jgi:hypothetical protein
MMASLSGKVTDPNIECRCDTKIPIKPDEHNAWQLLQLAHERDLGMRSVVDDDDANHLS